MRTLHTRNSGSAHWRIEHSFAVLAILGAFAQSPGTAAPILNPPVTLAHCAVNSSVLDGDSTCVLGALDKASASVELSPFVSLVAQANSPTASGIHGAAASALVRYSFQVIGGNPGDVVPILIATSLSSAGTDLNLGIGFAALNVHTSAGGDSAVSVCTNTCTSSTFSGTLKTKAASGDTGNEVILQVQASVVGSSQVPESASAKADPFIFLDPSFPGADLYSIVVSPGVGNAASVPEPGSAMLMALAALAMGILRCRGWR